MDAAGGGWTPGPIGPKPVTRTVPLSVRMPADLFDELDDYARKVRAPRSYLVVECIRRLLQARPALARGRRKARRSGASRRPPR